MASDCCESGAGCAACSPSRGAINHSDGATVFMPDALQGCLRQLLLAMGISTEAATTGCGFGMLLHCSVSSWPVSACYLHSHGEGLSWTALLAAGSTCPEGGARKKISDPILSFWSKLGTGVREGFLYTPDTPQKNSEEKKFGGGRGGRWVSEVSFRFF